MAGDPCAVVTQSNSGNLSLCYLPEYQIDQTPVSLSMPVSSFSYPKRKVLPFLKGLLPDNPNALTLMANRLGVSAQNPFAILSKLGSEVAGALSFGEPGAGGEADALEALSEAEIAGLLQDAKFGYETGVDRGQSGIRLSIAGAQPKLALHRDGGSWFLPSSLRPSTHILKPVPTDFPNLHLIEHLTMRAAAQLGLRVADSSVRSFGSVDTYITTRFDRQTGQFGIDSRLHQEDLLQALGLHPEKKYQVDGGPGLKDAARLFRSFPRPVDRQRVAKEFFRAVIFIALAGVTDAHAKNFSLRLSGDQVELTPLYDLATTLSFPALARKLAMEVNGKFEPERIVVEDFLALAEAFELSPSWVRDEFEDVARNLEAAFSAAADSLQLVSGSSGVEAVRNCLAQLSQLQRERKS
jgi:serine/threonine-protein kinase HipA